MPKRKRYGKRDRNEQLLEQCSPESMLHESPQLELSCYDQLIMEIIPKRRRKTSNKDDDHCDDLLHETLEDKKVVTHPTPAKTCRRILQFDSEEEAEEGQKTIATSTPSLAASILQLDLPAVSDCGGCNRSLRDPDGGIGYCQKCTRSPWKLTWIQNTNMVDNETLQLWAMVMQELKTLHETLEDEKLHSRKISPPLASILIPSSRTINLDLALTWIRETTMVDNETLELWAMVMQKLKTLHETLEDEKLHSRKISPPLASILIPSSRTINLDLALTWIRETTMVDNETLELWAMVMQELKILHETLEDEKLHSRKISPPLASILIPSSRTINLDLALTWIRETTMVDNETLELWAMVMQELKTLHETLGSS